MLLKDSSASCQTSAGRPHQRNYGPVSALSGQSDQWQGQADGTPWWQGQVGWLQGDNGKWMVLQWEDQVG